MKNSKFYIASLVLIVTILVSFAIPKPKYQGTSILSDLNMPTELAEWKSLDYSNNLTTTKDDRFNFLSGAFARIYGVQEGRALLMLILDAGNFHHPQLCYNGSGFKITELGETELQTYRGPVKIKTFLAKKEVSSETLVIMYWMCINKQKVDWTEQKLTQLWHSLFNKQQVGLMTRLDIPVGKGTPEEAVAFGQRFIADLSAELPADKAEWVFGK